MLLCLVVVPLSNAVADWDSSSEDSDSDYGPGPTPIPGQGGWTPHRYRYDMIFCNRLLSYSIIF